jgi:hypothetical protein
MLNRKPGQIKFQKPTQPKDIARKVFYGSSGIFPAKPKMKESEPSLKQRACVYRNRILNARESTYFSGVSRKLHLKNSPPPCQGQEQWAEYTTYFKYTTKPLFCEKLKKAIKYKLNWFSQKSNSHTQIKSFTTFNFETRFQN